MVAVVTEQGLQRLAVIENGAYRYVDIDADSMPAFLAVDGSSVWLVAGNAATPLGIVGIDIDTGAVDVAIRNFDAQIDAAHFSRLEAITSPTSPTTVDAFTHGFYYPPTNPAGGEFCCQLEADLVDILSDPNANRTVNWRDRSPTICDNAHSVECAGS